MSTIAIWGATGFVGRHLVDALLARGHSVRALCRRPENMPAPWRGRVDAYPLAFGDPMESVRAAVRDCDYVYHCAGHVDDEAMFRVYEQSVVDLSRAAADSGAKRVVVLSSVAVYGIDGAAVVGVDAPLQARTAYGQSRIRAERLAQEAVGTGGTSTISVRVPAVVGVGMPGTVLKKFFRAIRWGAFVHPGRIDAVFGCIGVHRLADCLAGLVEATPMVRTCQFADNLSWVRLAEYYGEAAGKRIVRIPAPGFAITPLLRVVGLSGLAHVLNVLDSRIRYEDDAERLGVNNGPNAPQTVDDVKAVIADCLGTNKAPA